LIILIFKNFQNYNNYLFYLRHKARIDAEVETFTTLLEKAAKPYEIDIDFSKYIDFDVIKRRVEFNLDIKIEDDKCPLCFWNNYAWITQAPETKNGHVYERLMQCQHVEDKKKYRERAKVA